MATRVGGREHALGLAAPVLGRIKNAYDQPASAPGSCLHDAEAVPAEQRERPNGQIDVRHARHQAGSLRGRCSHNSLRHGRTRHLDDGRAVLRRDLDPQRDAPFVGTQLFFRILSTRPRVWVFEGRVQAAAYS